MNTLIDAAIARKVDGIAVTLNNDDAYQGALCRAQKAGIAVVSFNVDSSQGSQGGACRSAFIGQNLEEAGYTLGKRLVASGRLNHGDLVFTPVEFPDASYAILRQRGVARALAEIGAHTEIVGTGNNPPDVLVKMQQYLIGHPDTKAIVTLGSVTGRMAVQAADGANRKDIAIATFDNSVEITDGIKSGRIVASADQQPYAQGFYSVAALVLSSRYGLAPSDVQTGTRGLTDKSSVESVANIASLLGTYR
jgi:simple sugar transport system substrate-binding protein